MHEGRKFHKSRISLGRETCGQTEWRSSSRPDKQEVAQLWNQSGHRCRNRRPAAHASQIVPCRRLAGTGCSTTRSFRGKVVSGEWRWLDPVTDLRVP